MARIKMPAARSKAQEITFEEVVYIFLTASAARGFAEKALGASTTSPAQRKRKPSARPGWPF